MHKKFRLVLAILFVFGILLVNGPDQAQAKKLDPVVPVIAAGSWTTGSVVDISKLASSAPGWLQLLSTDGVKVTVKGQICHPLRGGQFGWVGEIRQYKDGRWVKLATTNDWVPNKEGEFMACAQAPDAGTYALFGYFIEPPAKAVEQAAFDCSAVTWSSKASQTNLMVGVNGSSNLFMGGNVTGVTDQTLISYEVISSSPSGLVGTPGSSGSGTLNAGVLDITTSVNISAYASVTVLFTELEHGCTSTTLAHFA